MSLDAAITAKPTRLEGKPLLFFLTLLAALGMLATNMYLASFPSLGKELAATSAQVKLTLTVFLLGFAGGQLIVGPLSDRYGRRPLLLAGLVVYAATGVFIALSVSIEWMIGLRIAQAVGACTGSVLARAVARDLFSGDALTRSLGLVTTLTAAAPGFSPLIGGLIETYFGWRGTFLLLAFVGVFAATIVWLRVPETHRERDSAPGLGAAFASYLTLLRERSFMVPALATTCAMTGLFAFFASSPGIFIERFGVPPAADDPRLHAPREGDATTARIGVVRDGLTREVGFLPTDESILAAAARAGMDVPYSCKSGVCSTCRAKLLEGQVRMDRNFALEKADLEAGFILTCQAHPLTERVLISFDHR